MALAKMDMVSKSVLDIMTVEAPSGLGLAAPSNELALMGIDIQPWIMPGAIDTSTDQDLERIAKKGVSNSLAALQQLEGNGPSPRVGALWDNLGALAKPMAKPIINPIFTFPHINMVSWIMFAVISGISPKGTGCFIPAHIVKKVGDETHILTHRLDPVNSFALDADDLKTMARSYGCKYSLQLLAEFDLATLPLEPHPPLQPPSRCIPFGTGSILEAAEKELNVCLREPVISTAALIHAGLWDLAKLRPDWEAEFAKWVSRSQRITQAAAAAHIGALLPSGPAPPNSPTAQFAALNLGSKRPSTELEQPSPKRACSPVLRECYSPTA
eukprot:gene13553-13680_t